MHSNDEQRPPKKGRETEKKKCSIDGRCEREMRCAQIHRRRWCAGFASFLPSLLISFIVLLFECLAHAPVPERTASASSAWAHSKEAISMIYWFLKKLIKFKINRPRPQRARPLSAAATWIIMINKCWTKCELFKSICFEWFGLWCRVRIPFPTLKCNQTETLMAGEVCETAHTAPTKAKGFAVINEFGWIHLPFRKRMKTNNKSVGSLGRTSLQFCIRQIDN